MKFLCIADQQLGVASVTLESQEDVWDKAVTLAIANDVAGVLHAGDLFEHAIVEGQVLAAFRRPLARLREAGIPMLMIRGNHDGAVRPVDALDVFHEYPGLTVSQRPELIPFGGAKVVTLPWVSPKHLVAASNGASRENVYEAASEMLVGIARDLLNLAVRDYREEADPIILLLHWSVSGASLPTGLPVDQLHDVILPWTDLDALGFDAVVCGHIHKPQILGNGVFYCGSPQQLNHGEANDEHGVWLIEPGQLDETFLPIESPRFVTLEAWDDWGAADIEGAIVRDR
jgi:DNA repair protein SbcD/Mre11